MTELRAAVEAAERSGGCVLLSGAPGVGKSTLSHLWCRGLPRNCVFAYGRCRDGAPTPYSALGDALGSIVRTMEATGPAERDRWRADLAQRNVRAGRRSGELVPGLTQVLGDTTDAPDLDAADARRRLHRAAIRLVSAAAAYRPVVLAIDDLQWADRDSLLLLSELLTVSLRNVLVLGAHRAGEFDPSAAGIASASLTSIELEPLAREHVEELLAAVCGQSSGVGRCGRRIPPSHRRQSAADPSVAVPRATRRRAHPGRSRRPPELGPPRTDVDRGHRHGRRVPRRLPRPAAPARPGGVEFAGVHRRRVRPRRRHGSGRASRPTSWPTRSGRASSFA